MPFLRRAARCDYFDVAIAIPPLSFSFIFHFAFATPYATLVLVLSDSAAIAATPCRRQLRFDILRCYFSRHAFAAFFQRATLLPSCCGAIIAIFDTLLMLPYYARWRQAPLFRVVSCRLPTRIVCPPLPPRFATPSRCRHAFIVIAYYFIHMALHG